MGHSESTSPFLSSIFLTSTSSEVQDSGPAASAESFASTVAVAHRRAAHGANAEASFRAAILGTFERWKR